MPSQSGSRRSWSHHLAVGLATLAFALATGLAGSGLSLLLRLPGFHGFGPAWQVLARAHAPILMFFTAIPALIGGFGTIFVPLQVGARDTAFPGAALGALVFTMTGLAAAIVGLVTAQPLWFVAAVSITGFGAVLGASNLVATILNERTGALGALTVFVWSQLIAATLIICAAPMMAASFSLSVWRGAGTEPALARVIAPALCVLILPAFGLISEIVASLAQRAVAGRRTVVLAMAALAAVAFMGWAVALLHGGADSFGPWAGRAFAATIAIPTMVITFCWTMTLSRSGRWGALAQTPGLHAVGFVASMLAGALAALLSDTMHDAVSLATMFALFAGFYWWAPRLTGRRIPEALGRVQSWLLLGGVVAMLLPVAGLRVLGAAMVTLSVGLFGILLLTMILGGKRAATNPWGAATRDWMPTERGRPS